MSTDTSSAPISKAALWTGRVLSYLPALGLPFSASMKLAHPPSLDEGFQHFGIPVTQATGLGILEAACAIIYLIPRTSVLGAILMTGYLGGAIQVHTRLGEPVYIHIILGMMVWGGLFLRDRRLRALIPLTA